MSPVRRLGLTLIIAALVGSSCGGGGKKDGNGQYGSDLLTGTTVTVAPGATTPPEVATTTKAGGGKTVTTKKGTSSNGGTLGKTAGADPIAEAAHSGDGEFAGMLLASASPAKKIIYEVMTQEGLDLKAASLTHVTGEIKKYSGKPVQIEHTSIPGGPSTWDSATVHRYADQYTRFKSGGDTAVMHALVLHGNFPGAAGVATRGDVMSVYPDSYKSGSVAISGDTVEDIVVMHETGHLLGLVDLFLNTGRGDTKEDPAPGGHHSPNHRSVMYYTVDQISVSSIFQGGPPREYDANDTADLQAIHNNRPKGSKTRS
jgi:hypothetical protein